MPRQGKNYATKPQWHRKITRKKAYGNKLYTDKEGRLYLTSQRTNLAVCCRRAFKKVSGWNRSDKSKVLDKSFPDSALSAQLINAKVLLIREVSHWTGSSGPESQRKLQSAGTCCLINATASASTSVVNSWVPLITFASDANVEWICWAKFTAL